MKIALHDNDATGYPNLALMKLAAYHKTQGDAVAWLDSLWHDYDKVYSSKVFTFSEPYPYLPADAVKGGTGNDMAVNLPDAVEHVMPEYGLYGIDYSMGFVTRGCPRRCVHCFVPDKEAVEVVRFLKSIYCEPFCQPYRDPQGTEPTKEQKDFARWVNMKATFMTVAWEDYRKSAA